MKSTIIRLVAVIAIVTCSTFAAEAKTTKKKSCACGIGTLQQIMATKKLNDGWNRIAKLKNGDVLYAAASGGKVTEWRVKTASGQDLQTWIRSSPNGDLRIWWAPAKGASLFIEGPADVIGT